MPAGGGGGGERAAAADVSVQTATGAHDCVVSSVAVRSWHLRLLCSLRFVSNKAATLLSLS